MLVLSDPLRDNSKGYRWAERSGACQFRGGAYHISEVQHTLSQTCTAHGLNVSDFAFEVQMTIIKGDCGGLGLRVDIAKNNSYILQICADGHYKLLLYVMNPRMNAGGLQYPLTDTAIIPPSLRTHNRHHDGCP